MGTFSWNRIVVISMVPNRTFIHTAVITSQSANSKNTAVATFFPVIHGFNRFILIRTRLFPT